MCRLAPNGKHYHTGDNFYDPELCTGMKDLTPCVWNCNSDKLFLFKHWYMAPFSPEKPAAGIGLVTNDPDYATGSTELYDIIGTCRLTWYKYIYYVLVFIKFSDESYLIPLLLKTIYIFMDFNNKLRSTCEYSN